MKFRSPFSSRWLAWVLFPFAGIILAGPSGQASEFHLGEPFHVSFSKLEFSAGETVAVTFFGEEPVVVHNELRQTSSPLAQGSNDLGTIPIEGGVFPLSFVSADERHIQVITIVGEPRQGFVGVPSPVISVDSAEGRRQVDALRKFTEALTSWEFQRNFLPEYDMSGVVAANIGAMGSTFVVCTGVTIPVVGKIFVPKCVAEVAEHGVAFFMDALSQMADHLARTPGSGFSNEDARLIRRYLSAGRVTFSAASRALTSGGISGLDAFFTAADVGLAMTGGDVEIFGRNLSALGERTAFLIRLRARQPNLLR